MRTGKPLDERGWPVEEAMGDIVDVLRSVSNTHDGSGYLMEEAADEVVKLRGQIDLAWAALANLHDWYVDYARINNLFNGDGTTATFHELLEARRVLEGHQENSVRTSKDRR